MNTPPIDNFSTCCSSSSPNSWERRDGRLFRSTEALVRGCSRCRGKRTCQPSDADFVPCVCFGPLSLSLAISCIPSLGAVLLDSLDPAWNRDPARRGRDNQSGLLTRWHSQFPLAARESCASGVDGLPGKADRLDCSCPRIGQRLCLF